MKTSVKKLDGNKVQVKVIVNKDEVNKNISQQYKNFALKYNFPGFRKGKAPRPVINNALGQDAVAGTVTDKLINEKLPLAIDKHELFYIGKPKVDDKKDNLFVKEDNDYEFLFTLELAPTVKLSSYEPVKIDLLTEKIEKKEIDNQIQNFVNNYADFKRVKTGVKVADGMQVYLDMKAKNDKDKVIDSLTNEDYAYIVGSGLLPKKFDENIIGLKDGEKKSFSISKPKNSHPYHDILFEKTKKIDFDIVVNDIREREEVKVTDEWVKEKMGIDSAKEFRKRIEDSMKQERKRAIKDMKELACLEQLEERCNDEIPVGLAEEKERNLLQDFFRSLQQQNMTFDVYLQQHGITPDEFKAGLKEQAENAVKDDMCLDSWAAEKNIKVSDGEIEDEFKQADAKNYHQMMDEWTKQGRLYIVRAAIKRKKAIMQIQKEAIITEITPEQLKVKNEKNKKAREERLKKAAIAEKKKREDAAKAKSVKKDS